VRLGFTWDDGKAERNLQDHRISFLEATDAFYDPNRVELFDEGHSNSCESRRAEMAKAL